MDAQCLAGADGLLEDTMISPERAFCGREVAMKIQPTVGRMIWYHPDDTYPGVRPADGQPLSATIAAVNEDGTLNLGTFDAIGGAIDRQNVPLIQDVEDIPTVGQYAEWMPYQMGQAKLQVQATEQQPQESQESQAAA